MKKIKIILAPMVLAVLLYGCTNQGVNEPETESTTPPTTVSQETDETTSSTEPELQESTTAEAGESSSAQNNILIAYFTLPETDGTDTSAGASRVVVDGTLYGNTQYLANVIQETTNGDLFAIETAQDYPGLHEPLVDQAADEQNDNARPKLAAQVENMADYDVIFLGYPNWWGDLPMPLYTFLEEYDLAGKTIIPFNSHGGSQFSGTINTIQRLQPEAEVVTDGFTVSRNTVGAAAADLTSWLQDLGYEN